MLQREGIVVVLGCDEEKVKSDFSDYLKDGHKVYGWRIGEPIDLTWMDKEVYSLVNGGIYTVVVKDEYESHREEYDAFTKKLDERKQAVLTNIGTAVHIGKKFIDSYLANLPEIASNPGVGHLEGAYKGYPALVCAAGPSLDTALPSIRRIRDKVVLIALDIVVRPLIRAGIVPDYAVGIDPMPEQWEMFKGLRQRPTLICLGQYAPEVMRKYRGTKYIVARGGNPIWEMLCQSIGDRGYIDCQGGSVSHLAYATAEYFGCSSIGLIGYDHCWNEDGNYHAGGGWKGYKPDPIPVEDVSGKPVVTSGLLIQFRNCLEDRIRIGKGVPTFHIGDTGLPIKGTTHLSLGLYALSLTGREKVQHPVSFHPTMPDVLPNVRVDLNTIHQRLVEIRRYARKAQGLIRRIKKMRGKGIEDTSKLLPLIDRLQDIAYKIADPLLNLVAAYHMQVEVFLRRSDQQSINAIQDRIERIDKQLARGETYYAEIIQAITLLDKRIVRTLRRLPIKKGGEAIG